MKYPAHILLLVCAASTYGETLTGRVVAITDGDTLTVSVERQQIKVKLNAVDAPEWRQPYGRRATQSLSDLAFQKDARLACHEKDRWERSVCQVWVQPPGCSSCGPTLDIGYAQILAGMAWWHREYAKEQTVEDRGSAENEARLKKLGLWQDKEPVPPWEWRRFSRKSSAQPSTFQLVTLVSAQPVTTDNFFKTLKRPSSPNNWLVAPADFAIKADAVSPVFEVSVSLLRETFKAVVLQSKAAVVEESGNGMHVVATTPLLQFKDDIRALFIPVGRDKSTIALYSASRVGYWDLGTNRRRLEDWISQTTTRLATGKK